MVVVGCNHSGAPQTLLERLAIPAGELGPALLALKQSVREALVLSTCNRTELYAVTGHAATGAELLLRTLAARAGLTAAELRAHAYVHSGPDAVRHALRVASGLDSFVLGEDQIQAQWKRALAHARVADTLGPTLDRLGASALSCGKRVRTFTGIGQHSVSVESLAIRAAVYALGAQTLAGRRVLVLGAGESAAIVVRHLRAHGATDVTVMSRSLDRASAFAIEAGVAAEPIQRIGELVPAMDAIICCTAAPHPVLGHAHFSEWGRRPAGRPLVCVDLGMPRDVEEAVATVGDVRVITMDELSSLAGQHRAERRMHVPAAEQIVAAETARFMEWTSSRGSAAAVARLHEHARTIADVEADVALARLPHLAPRDREIVTAMARRIVNKLLHAPSVALRQHPEADNIALALEFAFGLRGAGQALDAALPHSAAAPDAAVHIEEIA